MEGHGIWKAQKSTNPEKQSNTQSSVHEMVEAVRDKEEEVPPLQEKPLRNQIILETELDLAKRELEQQKEAAQYLHE